MAGYSGQLGHIGVGRESSWGSGAAPQLFIAELNRATIGPVVAQDFPEQVSGVMGVRRVRSGLTSYRGTVNFDVSAGGTLPLFVLSCFGTCTTTIVNTIGGYAYRHLFTFANTLSSIERPSLTLEHNHGSLYARRYTGCRVERLRLSLAGDESATLQADVDLVGKDEVTSGPASASFNTDQTLSFPTFTARFDAADNTKVRQFSVEFDPGLEPIPTAGGAGKLGRLPASGLDVTGEALLVLEGTERRSDYIAGTERSLRFALTGATIVSTWAYEVAIELFRARISDHDNPLAAGILNERIEFRGLWHDTNGVARVIVTNTTSGY
jgi:hypothetical protein